MEFNVNAKVKSILTPRGYTKRDGSQETSYSFVATTCTGNFDKDIVFEVKTNEQWQKMKLMVGCTYKVYFEIESHEWNGRWFTSCRAWKVEPVQL